METSKINLSIILIVALALISTLALAYVIDFAVTLNEPAENYTETVNNSTGIKIDSGHQRVEQVFIYQGDKSSTHEISSFQDKGGSFGYFDFSTASGGEYNISKLKLDRWSYNNGSVKLWMN
ncbi:hypothetical protein Metev_1167 [Methanohalobium evestigatum Z-7303]|uniref:Uncharacterized protein n=1 Tax=Methanohalobium evestigatum (strain ATCC BAA-1072 / DSM 3721 / NBRC 107634 / OCM 161 / Z-7303) TaxID=644295 RepID=D7E9A0_METEZ|nr:hypothetical protein [Methanohalobium evestigatum]ADI74048.1 hypothetical protein Metev_1167 [Methanohalobium evestigatum Z-7303]